MAISRDVRSFYRVLSMGPAGFGTLSASYVEDGIPPDVWLGWEHQILMSTEDGARLLQEFENYLYCRAASDFGFATRLAARVRLLGWKTVLDLLRSEERAERMVAAISLTMISETVPRFDIDAPIQDRNRLINELRDELSKEQGMAGEHGGAP